MNDLTQVRALEAYVAMMNTLDATRIEPILAVDFHYSSQWVLTDISSKQEFLEYITPKLIAIRDSGAEVWAEMGELTRKTPSTCVVMAESSKDNLLSVVLAKVESGKLKSLSMCGAPSPHQGIRSGRYPIKV
jgi:hypothetical protein